MLSIFIESSGQLRWAVLLHLEITESAYPAAEQFIIHCSTFCIIADKGAT